MGKCVCLVAETMRRGSAECRHCAAVAWEDLASVCFWIISVGSLPIPRVSQSLGRDRLGAAVMLEFWDLARSGWLRQRDGCLPRPLHSGPSASWEDLDGFEFGWRYWVEFGRNLEVWSLSSLPCHLGKVISSLILCTTILIP